ncbi:MAG: ATP-binding protein [Thermoguttaceae bacterium]|jgi:hypothetical protein
MLISFTVQNYRPFADEQTLSLEAVKDDSHPGHAVDCGAFRLLKTAAIYGPNASGKSSLLNALYAMQLLVRISATQMSLGDRIGAASPFRLDKARVREPSSFEVRLFLNGTEYQYGFSATRERVCDEWLHVKRKGGRSTNPLTRHYDPASDKTDWQLRGELKGAKDIVEKTRDNGLFLSRAAEMNLEFVAELYLWFRDRCSCLDLATRPLDLTEQSARRAAGDSGFRGRVERLIRDADFAIDGLDADPKPHAALPEDAPELRALDDAMRSYLVAIDAVAVRYGHGHVAPDAREHFAVNTFHRIPDSDETVRFSLDADESSGTQRFFALVGPVLQALDEGHLLVVDELDCSMHPQLTYKLVEMFHSPEANPKGAQLVFATHDTSLMTPALFRRDQIWLTEKTRKGAAVLFSLCEIEPEKRPRKDEPFEKHYLAGRYGGVPNFGPALEDFKKL